MMPWSDGNMMGSAGMMNSGGGFLDVLLSLIVYALAVVGLIALVRGWRGGNLGFTGRHSSEQILDERFARGEIDIEEYSRQRDLLRSHH